jgi:hypothetical protein
VNRLSNGRTIYATSWVKRRKAQLRRADHKAEGRCINDTVVSSHGAPEPGSTRCAECNAKRRKQCLTTA